MLTTIGVRVPDAVWLSDARRSDLLSRQPLTQAPEICVEVLSASNSQEELEGKTQAYLDAGAHEVIWVDTDACLVRFFHPTGEADRSAFGLRFDTLFPS